MQTTTSQCWNEGKDRVACLPRMPQAKSVYFFYAQNVLKGLNTTRGYLQINLQHISVQWNQEGCHRIHPQEKAP